MIELSYLLKAIKQDFCWSVEIIDSGLFSRLIQIIENGQIDISRIAQ
jgi:hypothetical protein